MVCRHCGVRIERSNYPLDYSPKFVHVTANGDRIGAHCQLQLAEPESED